MLLFGIYLKEYKPTCNRDAQMFIASLFVISKLRNHPTCPKTDEWIKNIW
jgi:hypothetical protein